MRWKVNNEPIFVATETRTLPIEYKDSPQRFWYMRNLYPVNILMHIKEINKDEGTVTFECKIPHALMHSMKKESD